MPWACSRIALVLLWLAAGSGVFAQFGPNLPIPGIPGRRHKTPTQGTDTKGDSNSNKRTISAEGRVHSIDQKQMEVAVNDGRILTLRLNPQTAFQRNGSTISQSSVVRQMTVHVDAEEDGEGFLTAVTVNVLKDPPKDDGESAASQPVSAGSNEENGETADQPRAI